VKTQCQCNGRILLAPLSFSFSSPTSRFRWSAATPWTRLARRGTSPSLLPLLASIGTPACCFSLRSPRLFRPPPPYSQAPAAQVSRTLCRRRAPTTPGIPAPLSSIPSVQNWAHEPWFKLIYKLFVFGSDGITSVMYACIVPTNFVLSPMSFIVSAPAWSR